MTKLMVFLTALLVVSVAIKFATNAAQPEVPVPTDYYGGSTPLASPIRLPESNQDAYYMTLFASQNPSNRAYCSHTFATFSRKDGQGNLSEHTISWMPRNLNVRVLAQAEPGINLDLQKSISWSHSIPGVSVVRWGPYHIEKDLYDRALLQIDNLNSGRILYKAKDSGYRSKCCNCINAVADVYPDEGWLVMGLNRGYAATAIVKEHLKRWICPVETDIDSEMVAVKLGVSSLQKID